MTMLQLGERTLHATSGLLAHSHVQSGILMCLRYHVPPHLTEHIDFVRPGILLLTGTGKGSRTTDESRFERRGHGFDRNRHGHRPPPSMNLPMSLDEFFGLAEIKRCQTAMTPDCIAIMYNITKPTTAVPGNELGIFEDLGDVYSQTDLDDFFSAFAPYVSHSRYQR